MTRNLINTKELCLIGIFTALTAVLSPFSILLPFTPVPVTLGIIAVFITGMLLRPKLALLSQTAYLLLGGFGIPVFAGFKNGIGTLSGPTGGYLMIYPVMAVFISFMFIRFERKLTDSKYYKYILVFIVLFISLLLCYAGGSLWYSLVMEKTIKESLALTVYPYVLLDIIKIILCVVFIVPVRSRLKKFM